MNIHLQTAIATICCILLFGFACGCTVSEDKAKQILTAEGCQDITLHGYPLFACGKDDWSAVAFGCVKNGVEVLGTVCGGAWGKGYTVRYE